MSRLHIYFFRGLIAILPVALTLYLLYLFLTWSESLAVSVLRPFIGTFYFPGLGLALGVLLILFIGMLFSLERIRSIFQFIERPFTNTPVIKSIYSSLKAFADYFSPSPSPGAQQVVILRHPDYPIEMVGLITRHGVESLPSGFMPGERVAVYLPMSYMIGGYTVFVPAAWVQPIDMSVEEAMRSSLIAWLAGQDRAAAAQAARNPMPAANADAAVPPFPFAAGAAPADARGNNAASGQAASAPGSLPADGQADGQTAG
ncbi:MAG: DUF502 domain-containing protein [Pigmentiphaga sp.]|nr:DUF502 domain-containing protein [Pigmentiphaga sp.]